MASPSKPRVTGRVLVFDNGKLLLFKRRRFVLKKLGWIEYFSIPGGGVLVGEQPAAAARRELKEELGVSVELGPEVAVGRSKTREHHIFLGRITDGEPIFQTASEEAARASKYNSYEVVWQPVDELTEQNLSYYAPFLPVIRRAVEFDDISLANMKLLEVKLK